MFVKGKTDFGRGRCAECGRNYKKVQKNQRMCSTACRKRHHAAGGMSFERQAKLIQKLVAEEFARQRGALLAELLEKVSAATDPTQQAAAALRAALARLESPL